MAGKQIAYKVVETGAKKMGNPAHVQPLLASNTNSSKKASLVGIYDIFSLDMGEKGSIRAIDPSDWTLKLTIFPDGTYLLSEIEKRKLQHEAQGEYIIETNQISFTNFIVPPKAEHVTAVFDFFLEKKLLSLKLVSVNGKSENIPVFTLHFKSLNDPASYMAPGLQNKEDRDKLAAEAVDIIRNKIEGNQYIISCNGGWYSLHYYKNYWALWNASTSGRVPVFNALLEIKSGEYVAMPKELTEVDKLNKIEWKGTVGYNIAAMRYYPLAEKDRKKAQPGWSDWINPSRSGSIVAMAKGVLESEKSYPLFLYSVLKKVGRWETKLIKGVKNKLSCEAVDKYSSTKMEGRCQLQGKILFNKKAISEYTSNDVEFWFRNETTGKSIDNAVGIYDNQTGTYRVSGLPNGPIGISLSIHETGESSTFPGNLRSWTEANLSTLLPTEATSYNLDIAKIIHLTKPFDNAWYASDNPPYPEHSSPLLFAWKPIAGATHYDVLIQKYRDSPYAFVENVVKQSTTSTSVNCTLKPSEANTHYEFSVSGHNAGNNQIGYYMTTYMNAHGWDYRFKINDAVTEQTEMYVFFDTTETGILSPSAPRKVSGIDEWPAKLIVTNNLDLWLEIVPGISKKGVVLKDVECLASNWQEKAFGKAGLRLLPPKGKIEYNVIYRKAKVPFYAEARFGDFAASLMITKLFATLPVPGIGQLDDPVTFLEFWDKVRKIDSIKEAASALKSGKITDASKKLISLLGEENQLELLRQAFAAFKIEVSKEAFINFLTISKIFKVLNILGDQIVLAIQSKAGAKPVQVSFYLETADSRTPNKEETKLEKTYDEEASLSVKNAFNAALCYFEDHPSGTIDFEKLHEFGLRYRLKKNVIIRVLQNKKTDFMIEAEHEQGTQIYRVDCEGTIQTRPRDSKSVREGSKKELKRSVQTTIDSSGKLIRKKRLKIVKEQKKNPIDRLARSMAEKIAASGIKTVAVVDFTDLQGNVTESGKLLAENFSAGLVNSAKGFEVVDKSRLESILRANRLTVSGITDPNTAKKLGKVAGVDAVVNGTIIPFGNIVRTSAKLLLTQTGKVIFASRGNIPKPKAIKELLGKGTEIGSHSVRKRSAPPSAIQEKPKENRHALQSKKTEGTTVTERTGWKPKKSGTKAVFSIINCKKSGSYRAIRGDVPKEIDLSDHKKTIQILQKAAYFAQEKCPKKAPLGNISVTLYQGVEIFPGQWKPNYVVNARNYDANKLTWREYNNRALRKRLAKEKARKRTEEKRTIKARKKSEAEEEKHETKARITREAKKRIEALRRLEDAKGFKNIPKPIRKVIFEESRFIDYITLNLPREDDPDYWTKIKNQNGRSHLPILHLSHAYKIDAGVRSVLRKHAFINLEEFNLRSRWLSTKTDYSFLSYTEKIVPYIVEGFYRYKPRRDIRTVEGFKVKLASRLLKSIDYKNENKTLGIYAVAFSYTFQKEFPYYEELQRPHSGEFPLINKTYKGQAKAYLDPNSNSWTLEKLILPK